MILETSVLTSQTTKPVSVNFVGMIIVVTENDTTRECSTS
jgi:hypothetical protein